MSLIFVGIKNLNGIANLTKKLESLNTLTFGKVIDKNNRRAWQHSIGYVPQHIFLADDTVSANIAFGINPKDVNQEAVEEAQEIEDQTDLSDLVDVTQHNTQDVEAVNEGIDPATLPDEPNNGGTDEDSAEETSEEDLSSLLPFLSPVTTLAMIALAGMFVSIRSKGEE